jgi:hypothetical protein
MITVTPIKRKKSKQFWITQESDKLLKALAARLGTTETDTVQFALEHLEKSINRALPLEPDVIPQSFDTEDSDRSKIAA